MTTPNHPLPWRLTSGPPLGNIIEDANGGTVLALCTTGMSVSVARRLVRDANAHAALVAAVVAYTLKEALEQAHAPAEDTRWREAGRASVLAATAMRLAAQEVPPCQ
jgi:hypothetical protein